MKKIKSIIWIYVLAFVFLSNLTFAQSKTTSSLEGKVTDEENTALPGVEITISSPNLIGGAQSKITDAYGEFRFTLLSPGTYTVQASISGFVTQNKVGIRLFVSSTLDVDFVLRPGGIEEEITVIGEAPLIDIKDTQIGTREITKQVLQDVVYSREFYIYSVVDLAAGTTPVYHGSGAFGGVPRSGNAYQMDGVEFSEASGGYSWAIPDAFIFEEARVMGLGAPAEYDGFSGVLLSAVTKSGGNEFHGMFQFAYEDYNWVNDNLDVNDPVWALYDAPDKHGFFDPRIGLGGPILKDKLWFYGSARYSSNRYKRQEGDIERTWQKNEPKYFLKLTLQASSATRLSAFLEYDDFVYDYRYQTVFRPQEASSFEYADTYIGNISIFHTFSGNTILEFNTAFSRNWNAYGGYADDSINTSGHRDNITGMYNTNFKYFDEYTNSRFQANASLSHHADEFLGSSHDFKCGIEFERLAEDEEYGYNGGYWYEDNVYDFDDQQYHDYAYSYGLVIGPRGRRVSAFVQDSWQVGDRLTINPGLRFSIYRGHLTSIGETLLKTQGIAPRFGITWDVFGDHRTAIKAHYGRYLDKFATNKFSRAGGGIEDWIMYEVIDGEKIRIFGENFSNPADIDPNIKYPYMDQFTIGIERELMKNVSASFVIVYKKWGNHLYRVNAGATYEKVQVTLQDNVGNPVVVDAWDQISSPSEDHYLYTNPYKGQFSSIAFDPIRNYTGFIFECQKRLSNNWMFAGSFAYSKTTATSTSRNPNSQANSHWNGDPVSYWYPNIKIYGTYTLPFISISPTFEYRDGNRWTSYARAPVIGSPSRNIEQNGINLLPAVILLDLRIESGYTIKNDMRAAVFLDIYNVLNRGVPTEMYERVDSENYGLATDANLGRSFKVGVRFYF